MSLCSPYFLSELYDYIRRIRRIHTYKKIQNNRTQAALELKCESYIIKLLFIYLKSSPHFKHVVVTLQFYWGDLKSVFFFFFRIPNYPTQSEAGTVFSFTFTPSTFLLCFTDIFIAYPRDGKPTARVPNVVHTSIALDTRKLTILI